MANKTLAFEIGTEELPAFDLHNATVKLGGLLEDALREARISFDAVEVFTTPRRLIVIATGLPEATEESVEEFRGPSAKIAFDADGNPTKAATGFARGKGVDPADLERRDENGTEYVWAVKRIPAQATAELLPGILGNLITSVPWPKTQRWGSRHEQFSRPVRWLLALLDDEVVPVEFAGLTSGRTTRGHRFLAPGPHEVANATDLIGILRGAKVVLSEEERPGFAHGLIDAALIKRFAPAGDYSVFISGPTAMDRFVTKELAQLDLRPGRVRHELTGNTARPDHFAGYPLANADQTFSLTVHTRGQVVTIPARASESLLITLERGGIVAPAMCRSGVCSVCRSQLLDGTVFIPKELDHRRAADADFGYVNPCVTYPTSDLTLAVPVPDYALEFE